MTKENIYAKIKVDVKITIEEADRLNRLLGVNIIYKNEKICIEL